MLFLLYKIFLGTWVDLAWDKQKPGDLMIAFRIFSLSMLDRVVMPRVGSKAWISMGKYGLLPIKDCYGPGPLWIVQHSADMDLLAYF